VKLRSAAESVHLRHCTAALAVRCWQQLPIGVRGPFRSRDRLQRIDARDQMAGGRRTGLL